MTLVAFTIPDDPAALPAWLERRLVAADFGRFIAELSAAHPERGRASVPARQLLGDWYRKALSDGLGAVPVSLLQQLLRHPKCLLEFQEAILTEGGPYWDEVVTSNGEMAPAIERGFAALEAMFGPRTQATPAPRSREGVAPAARPSGARARREPRPPRDASRSYFTWAVISSALAACLMIAVGILSFRSDNSGRLTEVAAVSWGWAKPGGIPQNAPKPAEYLNSLASTANEWFDKRPDDAAGVAKRINEFRTGCSQLIFASHSALSQADKDWLIEKCRAWAKKLDDHLAALESGADPLKVRTEADETIRKLEGTARKGDTSRLKRDQPRPLAWAEEVRPFGPWRSICRLTRAQARVRPEGSRSLSPGQRPGLPAPTLVLVTR